MRNLMVIMLLLVVPTFASASSARVVEVTGEVICVRDGGRSERLGRGAKLDTGDLVQVGEGGQARLLVDEHAVVDLASGAELRLKPTERSGSTALGLLAGRMWARVSSLLGGESFDVETKNAVAGVRGTSFFADVDGDATTIHVEAGAVQVESRRGERALIEASQRLRVGAGLFERGTIDADNLAALRGRFAASNRSAGRERQAMDQLRGALRRERARDAGDGDGVERDGKLRDAMREAYRNRRDNPIDIDPQVARRILERQRERRLLRGFR